MKRILLAALAAAVCLALPASAMAANDYSITSTFTPGKSASKAKPAPVGGAFGFKVTDPEGKRPYALDAIKVDFAGIRMNTADFKTCSAAEIEQAQSDSVCSPGSLVASGFANNLAGNASSRDDASLRCYLTIKLYNSGKGKAALFVKGDPNAAKPCPIAVATAIPVKITRGAAGDSLAFTIPGNLKNPVATVRNALVETQLTLSKKTVERGKRTVGFFETVGGCKGDKRAVTVTFDNEGANDAKRTAYARCS